MCCRAIIIKKTSWSVLPLLDVHLRWLDSSWRVHRHTASAIAHALTSRSRSQHANTAATTLMTGTSTVRLSGGKQQHEGCLFMCLLSVLLSLPLTLLFFVCIPTGIPPELWSYLNPIVSFGDQTHSYRLCWLAFKSCFLPLLSPFYSCTVYMLMLPFFYTYFSTLLTVSYMLGIVLSVPFIFRSF